MKTTSADKIYSDPHALPIDLSRTEGQHSLNNMLGEHMQRHSDSDLVAVLTGKKSFKEALE